MKHFLSLFRHELRMTFTAPASFFAAVIFLSLMGFIYFNILDAWSVREHHQLPGEAFFRWFILPVLFMVPLLTMRSIAEERRAGTLEALMTTPVSPTAVVLAKFGAAYVFYCLLWACTLGFPYAAATIVARPEISQVLLDPGPLTGGFAFVMVTGTLFIAIGILSSCLTRSQLVAGMLSFSILFIIVVGSLVLSDRLGEISQYLGPTLDYINGFKHLDDFSRGVIDSRPFFFYLTNAALVLGLSVLLVEYRA